jgi:hypothetical protein
MAERKGEKGQEMEEFRRAPQPVVFMFQPTRFRIVRAEKLKEWEGLMRTRVGLSDMTIGEGGTGTCCVSDCPDADDCDQD